MKNFLITMLVIVLAFGLTMSAKAESRYFAEAITVVANSADRIITKIIIGAADNSINAMKIYFSDQGNTYDARANIKLVLDIQAKSHDEYIQFPYVLEVMNFLNSSTRYGIWFDDGVRMQVDAAGNTPHVTILTKRSSTP